MRAMSSNPYALHPPPVLPSTRIEYGGEGALYASQRSGEGWHVTPATKLCLSFLTIQDQGGGFPRPRFARLHAIGAGHPGHAEGGAQHRDQSPDRAGISLV